MLEVAGLLGFALLGAFLWRARGAGWFPNWFGQFNRVVANVPIGVAIGLLVDPWWLGAIVCVTAWAATTIPWAQWQDMGKVLSAGDLGDDLTGMMGRGVLQHLFALAPVAAYGLWTMEAALVAPVFLAAVLGQLWAATYYLGHEVERWVGWPMGKPAFAIRGTKYWWDASNTSLSEAFTGAVYYAGVIGPFVILS